MLLLTLARRGPQLHTTVLLALLAIMLFSDGRRYVAKVHLSVLDELPFIANRTLAAIALVAAIALFFHQKVQALVFLETAAQALLLVVAGRTLTTAVIRGARRRGASVRRTVLVGGGPVAAEIAQILARHREYGLSLQGFVDDGPCAPAEIYLARLGRLADLSSVIAATGANTLLVADGGIDEQALVDVVRTDECQQTRLLAVPRMHLFQTQSGPADHIGWIPIVDIRQPNLHGLRRVVKRLFDIVVALVASLVLMPLMILTALAVRLEGGRGVIFRQVRVGRDGKRFTLLKFRTLKPSDELESETNWCVANDSRIGPVGRFLRCTSIDELPQLWNILRGDMALVGPRPERPFFVDQFSALHDRYAHRHRVQGGLTGLAQVSGLRGNTSIAARTRYDNFYIENWSIWLDIKIILRTFREVVLQRGK